MLEIHENFLPTRGRPTMVQLQPKGGTSMTSKMGAMGFKDLTYGTYVFHAGFLRYLEIWSWGSFFQISCFFHWNGLNHWNGRLISDSFQGTCKLLSRKLWHLNVFKCIQMLKSFIWNIRRTVWDPLNSASPIPGRGTMVTLACCTLAAADTYDGKSYPNLFGMWSNIVGKFTLELSLKQHIKSRSC